MALSLESMELEYHATGYLLSSTIYEYVVHAFRFRKGKKRKKGVVIWRRQTIGRFKRTIPALPHETLGAALFFGFFFGSTTCMVFNSGCQADSNLTWGPSYITCSTTPCTLRSLPQATIY